MYLQKIGNFITDVDPQFRGRYSKPYKITQHEDQRSRLLLFDQFFSFNWCRWYLVKNCVYPPCSVREHIPEVRGGNRAEVKRKQSSGSRLDSPAWGLPVRSLHVLPWGLCGFSSDTPASSHSACQAVEVVHVCECELSLVTVIKCWLVQCVTSPHHLGDPEWKMSGCREVFSRSNGLKLWLLCWKCWASAGADAVVTCWITKTSSVVI